MRITHTHTHTHTDEGCNLLCDHNYMTYDTYVRLHLEEFFRSKYLSSVYFHLQNAA